MIGAVSKHFVHTELRCPCCGVNDIKEPLLDNLEKLRERYGKPMPITSGYRCSSHNRVVSKTGPLGPHTTGLAVDVEVDNAADAYRLVQLAFELGFTGIGIRQHGGRGLRMVHLDIILGVQGIPRPAMWTYA